MQGGQGPLGPGRSTYIARRIVAALVVLLVLALVGSWAWQTFLTPTSESGSEAPESASMGSSGTSAEETTTEEGSTTSTEEIVISEEESQERAPVSTEGTTESPEIVDLTPATVSLVPAAPVELPVNTSASEDILPIPTSNAPSLPSPIPPQPSPPAGAINEAMNSAAQVPPSPPILPQQQMVQPITFEEPVPLMGPARLKEEPTLGETTFTEQPPSEVPALEEGTSANVAATAGDTVAIAGRGATAISGRATGELGR